MKLIKLIIALVTISTLCVSCDYGSSLNDQEVEKAKRAAYYAGKSGDEICRLNVERVEMAKQEAFLCFLANNAIEPSKTAGVFKDVKEFLKVSTEDELTVDGTKIDFGNYSTAAKYVKGSEVIEYDGEPMMSP